MYATPLKLCMPRPKFHGENFANGWKSTKFVKVFFLKSFPLYGILGYIVSCLCVYTYTCTRATPEYIVSWRTSWDTVYCTLVCTYLSYPWILGIQDFLGYSVSHICATPDLWILSILGYSVSSPCVYYTKIYSYKVGMAVIKSNKTRVVVDVGIAPWISLIPSLLPLFCCFLWLLSLLYN